MPNEAESLGSVRPHLGPAIRAASRQPDEDSLDHLENLNRSKKEARRTDLLFMGVFAVFALGLVVLAITAVFLWKRLHPT